MKRIFGIIFLVACSISVWSQTTYVLATGVSRYRQSYNNLQQSTKDVKAFADIMRAHTPNVSILTSSKATHDRVLSVLNDICHRASEKDVVIFFYSGHGDKGAICTYDRFTQYYELVSIMSRCRARAVVMMVDACYSGSVVDVDKQTSERLQLKENMAFIVSSRGNEYSQENPVLGAGEFTQSLLKGLRGMSDSNRDRAVTIEELYTYVKADMARRGCVHHPQLIAKPRVRKTVLVRYK